MGRRNRLEREMTEQRASATEAAAEPAALEAAGGAASYWRYTLWAMVGIQFVNTMANSVLTPIMPLFLPELGVRTESGIEKVSDSIGECDGVQTREPFHHRHERPCHGRSRPRLRPHLDGDRADERGDGRSYRRRHKGPEGRPAVRGHAERVAVVDEQRRPERGDGRLLEIGSLDEVQERRTGEQHDRQAPGAALPAAKPARQQEEPEAGQRHERRSRLGNLERDEVADEAKAVAQRRRRRGDEVDEPGGGDGEGAEPAEAT